MGFIIKFEDNNVLFVDLDLIYSQKTIKTWSFDGKYSKQPFFVVVLTISPIVVFLSDSFDVLKSIRKYAETMKIFYWNLFWVFCLKYITLKVKIILHCCLCEF